MIRQFRKNPHFLAQQHAYSFYALAAVNIALLFLHSPSWAALLWYGPAIYLLSQTKIKMVLTAFAWSLGVSLFRADFTLAALLAIPFGVLITFPLTALLHSAAHASLKPRWLNRPVGEFIGLFQLSGFAQWKIVHVVHHIHTDDPELDPHPPGDKPYWEFTQGMREAAIAAYVKFYVKTFGKSEKSMAAVKKFGLMAQLDQGMKVLFWFLTLGPQLFTFLFVTQVVFKMFHYAWLNHSTHRPSANGFEVQNLNFGLYKFINAISFGLYFHRNHHISPLLFNPRDLVVETVVEEEKIAA